MSLYTKLFLYLLSCTCMCLFTWILIVYTLINFNKTGTVPAKNHINYDINRNKENFDTVKPYLHETTSGQWLTESRSYSRVWRRNNIFQHNRDTKRLNTDTQDGLHVSIKVNDINTETVVQRSLTSSKPNENLTDGRAGRIEQNLIDGRASKTKQNLIVGSAGEMGTGFDVNYENLSKSEMATFNRLYKEHNFNAYISNLIPAKRSLPDIRSKRCMDIQYNTSTLPQTSVIIVFHNEALSVLMRTIYSVVNRSPDYLLKELILVDDFSSIDELKEPLEAAIVHVEKVRMVRTKQHEGLIRARMVGVKNSTAPVLTFLDAHVECFQGWLEPLVYRVAEKPDAVVCPNVHTISGKDFKIILHDEIYVGSFRLSDLVFDWIPIQKADQLRRTSDIDTIRSPAFAGGLFSIQKKYFYKIGTYDVDMNLWGGENIEMSLRIWMCGGTIEIHPCSHVAHLFRQTNPLETNMKEALDHAVMRNNQRMADVWLGDYKQFYHEPGLEKVEIGDTSDRKKLKESLKCQSFDWYIQNVYPGLYVPGRAMKLGAIRNAAFDVCIDSGINILTAHVNVLPCANRTTQFWHLSKLNALQNELGCISFDISVNDEDRCTLERCSGGGDSQMWIYTEEHFLYNPYSSRCLGYATNSEGESTLQVRKCEHSEQFYWTWTNFGLEDNYAMNGH